MSPSAGERISSRNVEIKQREFPTRQPKERRFKVLGNTAQKQQPRDGGATYVTFQMEPINLEEGEPNGRSFPTFFLDTAPNAKTGIVSYEGPEGCMAFAKALGDELEPIAVDIEVEYTGKKREKMGKDSEKLTILSPDEVIDFIKAHDGFVVSAYEGLKKVSEKEKAEFPTHKDQNFIARWIVPEAQMGGSGEAVSGLPPRRQ